MSDSCAAVEAVERSKMIGRPETYRSFIELTQLLFNINIRILLVHIQGHSGIFGNEIADYEAKQLALFKGIIDTPRECLLSVNEAYRISSEIAYKSWQLLWDNQSTGCYTYELISDVNTKVTVSKVRDLFSVSF